MSQPVSIQVKRQSLTAEHPQSPATISLLVLLSLFGALYYLSFLLNPNHIGDLIPYLLVLISESFLIIQALITTWTIIVGEQNPGQTDFHYLHAKKSLLGGLMAGKRTLLLENRRQSIDVFITVYKEPLNIIEKTALAARDMVGLHQTYILDDGQDIAVKNLAKRIGVGYITRTHNTGAKAGNINNALRQTSGNFFVIFDVDHAPKRQFLVETLPFFADDTVAFIQTPQYFTNMDNVIAKGAGFAQRLFYELIQRGKNRFNSAFCVGTNVIFRRSAIASIGGIYEKSNSEDIWTSILLHEAGYRSIYIPNILAEGLAPDTIKGYLKQQLRWATGAFEILIRHNPLRSAKLSLDQKIQYLSTSAFYIQGIVLFFLLILPSLGIFLGRFPIVSTNGLFDWFIHYSAFYLAQILISAYFMKGFRWETLVMSMVAFPAYIQALINVIFNKSEGWNVTGKKDNDNALNYVIPQILMFFFLISASVIGFMNIDYYQDTLLAVLWNTLNVVIFGYFILIAMNEGKPARVRKSATSHFNETLKASNALALQPVKAVKLKVSYE